MRIGRRFRHPLPDDVVALTRGSVVTPPAGGFLLGPRQKTLAVRVGTLDIVSRGSFLTEGMGLSTLGLAGCVLRSSPSLDVVAENYDSDPHRLVVSLFEAGSETDDEPVSRLRFDLSAAGPYDTEGAIERRRDVITARAYRVVVELGGSVVGLRGRTHYDYQPESDRGPFLGLRITTDGTVEIRQDESTRR